MIRTVVSSRWELGTSDHGAGSFSLSNSPASGAMALVGSVAASSSDIVADWDAHVPAPLVVRVEAGHGHLELHLVRAGTRDWAVRREDDGLPDLCHEQSLLSVGHCSV